MTEHNFTLILSGDPEDHLDELFEAGCDDATFGEVDGVHYAEFDREAPSLAAAISSAIANVQSVGGLRVTRIEPDDLVTAAEIAERLGRTRESVRLLIAGRRGVGNFPPPISHLRERNRLWRWVDVADWAELTEVPVATEWAANARWARWIGAANASLELEHLAEHLPPADRETVAALAGLRPISKPTRRRSRTT